MSDSDFNQWMRRVNSIVENAIGLGVMDLPDAPYRDYFDSEMTPAEAVEDAAELWWDMNDDILGLLMA